MSYSNTNKRLFDSLANYGSTDFDSLFSELPELSPEEEKKPPLNVKTALRELNVTINNITERVTESRKVIRELPTVGGQNDLILNCQMIKMKAKIHELQQDNHRLKEEIETHNKTQADQNQLIQQLEMNLEKSKKTHKDQQEDSSKKIQELQTALDKVKQDCQKANENVDLWKKKFENASQESSQLTDTAQTREQKIIQIFNELGSDPHWRRPENVKSSLEHCEWSRQRLQETFGQLKDAKREGENLKKEMDQLKTKLASVSKSLDEEKANALKKQHDFTSSSKKAAEEYTKLKSDLKKWQDESSKLKNDLKKSKEETKKKEDALLTANEEMNAKRNEVDRLNKEIKETKVQWNESKKELMKFRASNPSGSIPAQTGPMETGQKIEILHIPDGVQEFLG